MFALLSSFSRKISSAPVRFTPRNSSRRVSRPAFENLEDRLLMSTYQVTNVLDHGVGSLRQAILNANAHPGSDVISFKSNVVGTIKLTTGQLTVTDPVQIEGPGASALAVSGNNQSRILQITKPGIAVSISGLTFTKGNPGINFGGAIVNKANLTLTNDVFSNNVAASFETGPTSGGGGAAIMSTGTVNITACTFDSNHVYAHDATLLDGGGAIYNSGTAKITRSTFSNNTGHLSPSVIPSGPNSDTFVASGGAIFNAGTLLLTNSTVYGNTVDGEGAGIFTSYKANSTLINCTVASNHGEFSGAFDSAFNGTLKLGNTIVAKNTDAGGEFILASDVGGNFTSLGHNLIGIGVPNAWLATDFVGDQFFPEDPKLGPLANNGGPTKTLAGVTGSPLGFHAAIGHGIRSTTCLCG
jgi:parallel beta-helix repeat protein